MKLFDKKSLILLISVISINLLCIISVSYAYFTANIIGNKDAKEMVVKAGTMEITYYDSNEVSLNSMLPGDSLIKKFKIVNTGTLDTKYNIKLIVDENDFIDKQDLVVTLKRNDKEDNVTNIVPVKEDGYILINEPMELKGVHDYTLTLTFKKDLEDTNQNDNANKAVKFKIGVDSNTDAEIYEYSYDKDNTFYSKLKEAELNNNAAYDDFGNIRYIGKDPNNYIWFNCDSYENLTNDTAEDEEHNCEKWRIIGDFKDTLKSDGTREDLIKIVRADKIGNIAWDVNNYNNWEIASLQKGLNGPYLENTDDNWITNEEYYASSYGTNTKAANYKGITTDTKGTIEKVTWNIGGMSGKNRSTATASDWYTTERGTTTYNNSRPITWDGYIGLIYPSDYIYATSGSGSPDDFTTNREGCLNTYITNWESGSYQTNCARNNSWLYTASEWTFMPFPDSPIRVYALNAAGTPGQDGPVIVRPIQPTLYLKSNIEILDGKGTNEEPYSINA